MVELLAKGTQGRVISRKDFLQGVSLKGRELML
jgi:hypothetical protein